LILEENQIISTDKLESLQDKLTNLVKHEEDNETIIELLQTTINSQVTKITKYECQIEQLNVSLAIVEQVHNDLSTEIKLSKNSVASYSANQLNLEDKNKQLNNDIEAYKTSFEREYKTRKNVEHKLNKLSYKNNQTVDYLRRSNESKSNKQIEKDGTYNDIIQSKTKEINELKQVISNYEIDMKEKEINLKNLENEYNILNNNVNANQIQLHSIEELLIEREHRVDKLENDLDIEIIDNNNARICSEEESRQLCLLSTQQKEEIENSRLALSVMNDNIIELKGIVNKTEIELKENEIKVQVLESELVNAVNCIEMEKSSRLEAETLIIEFSKINTSQQVELNVANGNITLKDDKIISLKNVIDVVNNTSSLQKKELDQNTLMLVSKDESINNLTIQQLELEKELNFSKLSLKNGEILQDSLENKLIVLESDITSSISQLNKSEIILNKKQIELDKVSSSNKNNINKIILYEKDIDELKKLVLVQKSELQDSTSLLLDMNKGTETLINTQNGLKVELEESNKIRDLLKENINNLNIEYADTSNKYQENELSLVEKTANLEKITVEITLLNEKFEGQLHIILTLEELIDQQQQELKDKNQSKLIVNDLKETLEKKVEYLSNEIQEIMYENNEYLNNKLNFENEIKQLNIELEEEKKNRDIGKVQRQEFTDKYDQIKEEIMNTVTKYKNEKSKRIEFENNLNELTNNLELKNDEINDNKVIMKYLAEENENMQQNITDNALKYDEMLKQKNVVDSSIIQLNEINDLKQNEIIDLNNNLSVKLNEIQSLEERITRLDEDRTNSTAAFHNEFAKRRQFEEENKVIEEELVKLKDEINNNLAEISLKSTQELTVRGILEDKITELENKLQFSLTCLNENECLLVDNEEHYLSNLTEKENYAQRLVVELETYMDTDNKKSDTVSSLELQLQNIDKENKDIIASFQLEVQSLSSIINDKSIELTKSNSNFTEIKNKFSSTLSSAMEKISQLKNENRELLEENKELINQSCISENNSNKKLEIEKELNLTIISLEESDNMRIELIKEIENLKLLLSNFKLDAISSENLLKEKESQLQDLNNEITLKSLSISTIETTLVEKQTTIEDLNGKVQELVTSEASNKESISTLQSQLGFVNKDMETKSSNSKNLELNLAKQESTLIELGEELKSLKTNQTKNINKIKSLELKIIDLNNDIALKASCINKHAVTALENESNLQKLTMQLAKQDLDTRKQELNDKLLTLTNDLEAMKSSDNLKAESIASLEVKIVELNNIIESKTVEVAEVKDQMKLTLSKAMDKIKVMKSQVEESTSAALVEKQGLDEHNRDLQTQLDSFSFSVQDGNNVRESLEGQVLHLNNEILSLTNDLELMKSQHEESLLTAVVYKETIIEDFGDKLQVLVTSEASNKETISTLQSQLEYVCKEKDESKLSVLNLKNKLTSIETAVVSESIHLEKIKSLQLDIDSLRDDIESKSANIIEFELKIENLESKLIISEQSCEDIDSNRVTAEYIVEELKNKLKVTITSLQSQLDASNTENELKGLSIVSLDSKIEELLLSISLLNKQDLNHKEETNQRRIHFNEIQEELILSKSNQEENLKIRNSLEKRINNLKMEILELSDINKKLNKDKEIEKERLLIEFNDSKSFYNIEIMEINKINKDIELELTIKDEKIFDLNNNLSVKLNEIQSLEERITRLDEDRTNSTTAFHNEFAKRRQFEDENKVIEEELVKLKLKINNCENELRISTKNIGENITIRNSLEEEISNLNQLIISNDNNDEIVFLENKIETLVNNMEIETTEKSNLIIEITNLNSQIKNIKNKINVKDDVNKCLELEITEFNNLTSAQEIEINQYVILMKDMDDNIQNLQLNNQKFQNELKNSKLSVLNNEEYSKFYKNKLDESLDTNNKDIVIISDLQDNINKITEENSKQKLEIDEMSSLIIEMESNLMKKDSILNSSPKVAISSPISLRDRGFDSMNSTPQHLSSSSSSSDSNDSSIKLESCVQASEVERGSLLALNLTSLTHIKELEAKLLSSDKECTRLRVEVCKLMMEISKSTKKGWF
jgi:chromosome segregation ATPase